MRIPLSFNIALRYLLSTRKQGYLSLISWFSLLGMTLGVASLIIVTSVMNGFEVQLRERILKVIPHILIENTSATVLQNVLRSNPHVKAIVPYKTTEAMLNKQGQIAGVLVNGTEPETLGKVSVIPQAIRVGSLDLIQAKSFNIAIGAGLARQLGLYLDDKVTVILPKVTTTPAGIFPRTKRFTIVAIFEMGADVDVSEVYVHHDDLRKLLRQSTIHNAFRLQVDDVLQAPAIASSLRPLLPNAIIQDWSATKGSLFQAVKVEKLMVALMLTVIIAVAAFNVVAVLTMMVINKRSAVAVLLTIGAPRRMVLQIFIYQGLLLGFVGSLAGLCIGLPIALYLEAIMALIESLMGFSLFDANVYYIAQLPSDVRAPHVVYVMLLALLMSVLATIYPAFKATQVQPSEVLRYE